MANTKYILEQIKIEGELKELLTKTNGENTIVTYNGTQMTLTAALASIYTSLTSLPTDSGIDGKISAAIDGLIGGAPEKAEFLLSPEGVFLRMQRTFFHGSAAVRAIHDSLPPTYNVPYAIWGRSGTGKPPCRSSTRRPPDGGRNGSPRCRICFRPP